MSDELREFHGEIPDGRSVHPVELVMRALTTAFGGPESVEVPSEDEEVIVTVWRVPRRLEDKQFTQLQRLMVERYGALAAVSYAQGSRRTLAMVARGNPDN